MTDKELLDLCESELRQYLESEISPSQGDLKVLALILIVFPIWFFIYFYFIMGF